MRGIVKNYGAVRANRGIDLVVGERRVVGLLGENGSGKSTLMKVLFGMIRPDSGRVVFDGHTLVDRGRVDHTPRRAMAAGIGMIHQHFTLVEAMNVTENVMLGWDQARARPQTCRRSQCEIEEASRTYGLAVSPWDVIAKLSFGQRQRVEIVKAILRGSKLLILDEPTSNLSPPEVAGLLGVIRRLREQGHSVVFISHKLSEVMEICDEVVVLRDGAVSGHVQIADATRESLARMMVERDLSAPTPAPEALAGRGSPDGRGPLAAQSLQRAATQRHQFHSQGRRDSGSRRGGRQWTTGATRHPCRHYAFWRGAHPLKRYDITDMNVRQRLEAGVAYIPVDRAGTSLVPGFTIADNMAMRDIDRAPLAFGPFLNARAMREIALRPHGGFRHSGFKPGCSRRFTLRRQPAEDRRRARDRPPAQITCLRSSQPGGSIPAPRGSSSIKSCCCAMREPPFSMFQPNSKKS